MIAQEIKNDLTNNLDEIPRHRYELWMGFIWSISLLSILRDSRFQPRTRKDEAMVNRTELWLFEKKHINL
jgi:hypothetical protein